MAIKVSIKQVQPQKIPVKITSGTGGLLQVEHDDTLVGLGTTAVPLGINPEYTKELTDKIGTVADALANETTNREQADELLRQEIKDNTESIGNNTDAINALNTNLNAEITAREQGDAEINKAISALNSGLQAESTARADADAILQENIDSEASTRASEDAKLAADIVKNATAISDEAKARNQADAALQDSITKEATTRSNADKALQSGIDAEATARTSADDALQTSITKNASDITTLRNDVDGLGDQVHEIETKIPGNASASNQLATKADVTGLETSLAKVATTGSYNDLGDKPTIGNAILTITRNNESAGNFTANATENKTINISVPVSASDVNALPDGTKYGASVSLTMDSTTYKVSASLKDQNGDVLGTVQTIDLPLESVVVSGSYDATTKEVVLTLEDGSEIRFSVADLVDGLQTEITETNKLSADLVDDSTSVNKFVTSAEKTTWNGKQDAIPDLATIRAGASKGATAVQPADLATVATSGSYNDLSNKPTIPAAQVNSDWDATSGVAQILNKPTLGTAASKDATDFATAAQGAKADTAVQPAAIADMETKTNAAATYQPKGDYATKTELSTGLATKADTATVNTELAEKQDKLVSGTNIKTVNGETLLGSGNVKIESGGAMPVGAIFTTPRTGTIEGAVEANGGEYNIADYSGAGSIGALLTAGNIAYVSKTEFQTRVANTGACDSFGWNAAGETYYAWYIREPDGTGYTTSTNPVVGDTVYYVSDNYTTTVVGYVTKVGSDEMGSYIMWTDSASVHYRDSTLDKTKEGDTTFLVPKLNPWHAGKNAPIAGNGMALGLTNGTQSAGLIARIATTSTTLLDASENALGTDVGTISTYKYIDSSNKAFGITTDGSKSGMVADLSETTNLRVMVQLATGATDQALETCTSVLSDVSALNAHRVIEFQAPTAANGYTWYRKYADGWVEQGGYRNTGTDALITITLPVEMADANYAPDIKRVTTDSSGTAANVNWSAPHAVTTTGFSISDFWGGASVMVAWGWEVKGMAA